MTNPLSIVGKKTYHVTMTKTYYLEVEEETADNAMVEAMSRGLEQWATVNIETEVTLCACEEDED